MFSSLSKNARLQGILKTSQHDAKLLESQVLLASSRMSRAHAAFQNALTAVTYLTQLAQSCQATGVDIVAAVHFESAHVLWEQGEMSTSIRMLQELQSNINPKAQSIHVGKPEVLAKLVIAMLTRLPSAMLIWLGSSNIRGSPRKAGRNHRPLPCTCYQRTPRCLRR